MNLITLLRPYIPQGFKMYSQKYFKETVVLISVITVIALNTLRIGGNVYGPILSCLIISVIFIVYIILKFKNTSIPPTKVIEQIVTLTFEDKIGRNANYHKIEKFRVIQDNITRLIERGIRSDGVINNINTSIGSCIADPAFRQDYIILFEHPLQKGVSDRTFSFNMENSFMSKKEYWILKSHGIMPTGKAIIKFHAERPPFKVRAFQIFDGAEADISEFLNEKEDNNQKIYELPFQKSFAGSRIHLEWEWKEVEI